MNTNNSPKQTIFEGLLIMAYNVGRSHAVTRVFPDINEGRKVMLEALSRLVDHIDKGDLEQPITTLLPSSDETMS